MSRAVLMSLIGVNTCITFYQIKTHFFSIMKIYEDNMYLNLQKDDIVVIKKYLQNDYEKRLDKE